MGLVSMTVLTDKWPASLFAHRAILARCLDAFAQALPIEQVILFGSHARGQARADSDVDLCVVTGSLQSQHRMAITLRRAIGELRGKPSLSIIPISAARLEEKKRSRDPFFDTVMGEGICLARAENGS
jgi:predicted nucleotidyltransferase